MRDKALKMGDINQDPSMEEILASIKRVIAEEDRSSGSPRGARGRKAPEPVAEEQEPEPEEDDVLELEDGMATQDPLLSDNTAAATRQSLAALAAVHTAPEAVLAADSGPLEAVVREMLKPMLKQWLDQRLPEIIEDMVSREIARITGKRL